MKSVNTVSIIENPSEHRREFTSHSAISCAKKIMITPVLIDASQMQSHHYLL